MAVAANSTSASTVTRGTLRAAFNVSAPWRAGNIVPIPPWKGTGSISAPSSPYIVTYSGSPASAVVDLFDRATNFYIMSTTSDAGTGAFSFTGLNTSRTFDVRARGDGFSPDENDMILANVTPG